MTVADVLAKAGGHKYIAKHKNPKGGWVYEYANRVSAVHHADPLAKVTKEKLIAILEDAAEDIGHLHQHERDADSAAMQRLYTWTAQDLRHVRHATVPKLRKILEAEYASKQKHADEYDGSGGSSYGDQLRADANVTRKMIRALSYPHASSTDAGLRHHTAPQRRHEAFQLSQAQAAYPMEKLPALMATWNDATLREHWHAVSKTYHTDAAFAMMDEMSRRASLPKPKQPDPGALAGPLAQTRMEFSMRRSPSRDFLRKARQGDMKQGHKYTSRHKGKDGEWEYVYASGAHSHADTTHQADMFGDEHAAAQGGQHGELPTPTPIKPKPKRAAAEYSHTQKRLIGPRAPAIRLTKAEDKQLDRRDDDVSDAYPAGSWELFYTDKQIDQMVELVELWADGARGTKIRSDGISQAVKRWGLSFGILGYGQAKDRYDEKVKEPGALCIEGAYQDPPMRGAEPRRNFMDFAYDQLPPEALWRVVDKFILRGRDHAGRTIAQEPGWAKLNIFPEGRSLHSNRDLDEIATILVKLQSWGYVYAQFGGSIWSIDTTKEYQKTEKSAASTVADVLSKAKRGAAAAGHKYESRTWNNAAGHWDYHYRAKDDPNNLTADHIFEIMNRNKVAGLRHMGTYLEWAQKEGSKEQQGLLSRLDATIYGIDWTVRSGRVSGTIGNYVKRLEGKELAKVIAAVLPHVHVQGDVPQVLIKMWGSDEKQEELRAKIRAFDTPKPKRAKRTT